MIEWVLAAIGESGVVDRTCVSTDDAEIAEVARAAGAEVPFLRPAELAGDTIPSIDVVEHALRWLEEDGGPPAELVLLVQPTDPFVRPEQIRDTLHLLLEHGADSAVTIVPVPRNHHPFHVRTRDADGLLEFLDSEAHYAHPRRQDDPPLWAFANLYWFSRAAFLRTRRLETGRRVGLVVDEISALDLNTLDDWRLAEALLASGAR